MKIDTTAIPNFDSLPQEAKDAILNMEFADAPDMSQYVAKSLFDKKASEAAELSRKLRAQMSEEEQAKAKQAEDIAAMQAELEQLRADKAVSEFTSQFLGLGYSEELAKSTAAALHKGDMQTLFKNHAKFTTEHEKALKAELLRDTPKPPAGEGSKGMSKEEFQKLSLTDKQKFASENPEQYKEFYK